MKKACILLASPRKQGNTAALTAPFAAELDRLVYGMNKYYGREKGPSLWEGKPVALIATCGYPVERARTFGRPGCSVTASTPVCGHWVCWPSGTGAMTRCS